MADRKNRMAATSVFLGTLAACLALMSSCGTDDSSPASARETIPADTRPDSTTSTESRAASVSTTTSTTGSDTRRSANPLTLEPGTFVSAIGSLDPVVLERVVGSSWNPECPVPIEQLRYVEVSHATVDGEAIGELIVHERVAADVVGAFATLYEAKFPIESMRLIDDFDADDIRSMQANNTSAFNCRFVAGTDNWSWHAYGLAIDINPLINPYVKPDGVSPPEGAAYTDRSLGTAGMIVAGDVATTAFADIGWEWGGLWINGQDYQHFTSVDG